MNASEIATSTKIGSRRFMPYRFVPWPGCPSPMPKHPVRREEEPFSASNPRGMRRPLIMVFLVLCALIPAGARGAGVGACVPTPRAPANPVYQAQDKAFGFHDEELVICSPGWSSPTHIAARMWVPATCPGVGKCAGVVIAHGFGFSKELTFSDMLNAVRKKLYVLSYDVRGQGSSGGQADFLGRNDVADEAA